MACHSPLSAPVGAAAESVARNDPVDVGWIHVLPLQDSCDYRVLGRIATEARPDQTLDLRLDHPERLHHPKIPKQRADRTPPDRLCLPGLHTASRDPGLPEGVVSCRIHATRPHVGFIAPLLIPGPFCLTGGTVGDLGLSRFRNSTPIVGRRAVDRLPVLPFGRRTGPDLRCDRYRTRLFADGNARRRVIDRRHIVPVVRTPGPIIGGPADYVARAATRAGR